MHRTDLPALQMASRLYFFASPQGRSGLPPLHLRQQPAPPRTIVSFRPHSSRLKRVSLVADCDPEETSALQMAIAAKSSITDITRIVNFITEASAVQRILTHIAELAQAPPVSLAREPTLVLGEDAAMRHKGIRVRLGPGERGGWRQCEGV